MTAIPRDEALRRARLVAEATFKLLEVAATGVSFEVPRGRVLWKLGDDGCELEVDAAAFEQALDEIRRATRAVPEVTYVVSPEDMARTEAWTKQHEIEAGHSAYAGAIGGRYTREFTPTSLGTVHKVRCSCGATLDLTDYDSW